MQTADILLELSFFDTRVLASMAMAQMDGGKELFLDILTKEEREALLTKKMEAIRKKNQVLQQRHEEIEADKRKAEKPNKPAASPQKEVKPLPGEDKYRGNMKRESTHQEVIITTAPSSPEKKKPKSAAGRGKQLANMSKENWKTQDVCVTRPAMDDEQLKGQNASTVMNTTENQSYPQQNSRASNGFESRQVRDKPQEYETRIFRRNSKRESPARNEGMSKSDFRNHRHFSDAQAIPSHREQNRHEDQGQRCSVSPSKGHLRQNRNTFLLENRYVDDPSGELEADYYRSGGHVQSRGSVSQSKRYMGKNQISIEREKENNGDSTNVRNPSQGQLILGHSRQSYKDEKQDTLDGPPPDPSYNFLADRSRDQPQLRTPKEEWKKDKSRRHPKNFGGEDFSNVKAKMKSVKEKQDREWGGPPRSNMEMSMVMTGRERHQYIEWKNEREKVDQERIERHKTASGEWRRAWDAEKKEEDFQNQSPPCMEPARRPGNQSDSCQEVQLIKFPFAGRIGSGRFDRGERDERQRGDGPHMKGIAKESEAKLAGAGRGRGRSRGRSRGRGQPRVRTSSGEEGRKVERQKDLLVVKIDNSPGKRDNSVEVEYSDSELPPDPRAKLPSSAPTRSVAQTSTDELWWDEDLDDIPLTSTEPDSADGVIGEIMGGEDHEELDGEEEYIEEDQFEDVPSGGQHKHSQGDTDEWEDCEEEEFIGTQGSNDSIHIDDKSPQSMDKCSTSVSDNEKLQLNCKLNPEAPVFTPSSPLSPLSPEVMKTPEGHVKVPDWADAMKSPTTSLQSLSISPLSSQSGESDASPKDQRLASKKRGVMPKSKKQSSEETKPAKKQSSSHSEEKKKDKISSQKVIDSKVVSPVIISAKNSKLTAAKEADTEEEEETFETPGEDPSQLKRAGDITSDDSNVKKQMAPQKYSEYKEGETNKGTQNIRQESQEAKKSETSKEMLGDEQGSTAAHSQDATSSRSKTIGIPASNGCVIDAYSGVVERVASSTVPSD